MTIDVFEKSIAFVFNVEFDQIVFGLESSVKYSELRLHKHFIVQCLRNA
jgi:hypothetical protein